MSEYIEPKDVAKIVRTELKKNFPGYKFSVKTSVYSMGASIDVSWINGPSEQAVEDVVGKYHGADFDGMEDLKKYNGKPYGNDYILFHRKVTEDHYVEVAAQVIDYYGIDTKGLSAKDALDSYVTNAYEKLGTHLRTYCWRIISKQSF
jgi:hypothetical protein